jgi:hypothetical protein
LKQELPKQMWADLQLDLQPIALCRKAELEKRIEESISNCTERFFESCQRSIVSPPTTPRQSIEPRGEKHDFTRSDTTLEEIKTSTGYMPNDAQSIPQNHHAEQYSRDDLNSIHAATIPIGHNWPSFSTIQNSPYLSAEVSALGAEETPFLYGDPAVFGCSQSHADNSLPQCSHDSAFSGYNYKNRPWEAQPQAKYTSQGERRDSLKTAEELENIDYTAMMPAFGPTNSSLWDLNNPLE